MGATSLLLLQRQRQQRQNWYLLVTSLLFSFFLSATTTTTLAFTPPLKTFTTTTFFLSNNHHHSNKNDLRLFSIEKNNKKNTDNDNQNESRTSFHIFTRQDFFQKSVLGLGVILGMTSTTTLTTSDNIAVWAFDGGVGGLGKTKPITGVQLFEESSTPIQNSAGVVSAEIQSLSGKPIRVEFQTPWPLLSGSSGLEARDLQNSESAFVQVIPLKTTTKQQQQSNNNGADTDTIVDGSNWKNPKIFKSLLLDTVLASKGKYGAYGAPIDIKVKPIKSLNEDDATNATTAMFSVTFTSYTPAMRESERQIWMKCQQVDDDTLVSLIVGTTKTRFPSQEKVFTNILSSYTAVLAPESNLLRRNKK